ncbi:sensor histidine kinase [Tenacibaculum sp. SG-28]|uniref:sensor histidine kinase n=1 Tax=Tenacibaculum sp. SG-28 TaxID=754426 RepID=UPI001304CB31|nr:histidine kinase [Tenacibaculum sp. SG-28]
MFLNTQYLENSIDFLFPDYYFISNYSLQQNFLIFFSISFFALSIKLVQDWVLHNHYEKEHIEQRLQALKSQINPHFLFNSLNVIYSLSIGKNQQVSDAVLQLSDILRYVIYDTDRLTLISKEIELIKNYIAFEKNRHSKKENILFETFLDEDSSIHPMLFLPLVENSFKHGLMSSIENPFIKIVLTKKKRLVHFYIENKFDKNNTFTKKVYGGVGIANVKKNLEIIYPDQYEFQKQINKEIYSVSLKINLN